MPWANYFSLFSLTFHIYKISPTIIPNLLWHYELNDLIHSKELQLFSGMDFTCLHRDFFIDYILDVKLLSYKFMKIALFCFVFNLINVAKKSTIFILFYFPFLFAWIFLSCHKGIQEKPKYNTLCMQGSQLWFLDCLLEM